MIQNRTPIKCLLFSTLLISSMATAGGTCYIKHPTDPCPKGTKTVTVTEKNTTILDGKVSIGGKIITDGSFIPYLIGDINFKVDGKVQATIIRKNNKTYIVCQKIANPCAGYGMEKEKIYKASLKKSPKVPVKTGGGGGSSGGGAGGADSYLNDFLNRLERKCVTTQTSVTERGGTTMFFPKTECFNVLR